MSPSDPEALRVAFLVLDVLQRFGIPHHLGGSYASSVHGTPRQTNDVDLVVDMGSDRAADIASALEAGFYVEEQAVRRAIRDHSSFNLIHLATGIKIDVFIKGPSPFEQAEFDRSVVVPLGGAIPRNVRVKSPEDTVLRKLLWFRMGGETSDRQWEDVRGILRAQAGRLDRAYMAEQATSLGLSELLERALLS